MHVKTITKREQYTNWTQHNYENRLVKNIGIQYIETLRETECSYKTTEYSIDDLQIKLTIYAA